jgi:hypothetical protein
MRTIRWVGCVLFLIASLSIGHGEEPGAVKAAPFWGRPKSTIDLQGLVPADVKLAGIPSGEQGFVVLQVGDFAPPVDFVFGNEDLKQFLPEKDSGYAIVPKGLVVGAKTYGDRNYKIEVLPKQFEGLTLLRTKGGHKGIADITYSIVVDSPKPCFVFVAIDQRVMETYLNHGIPGWLNEYEPTGEVIKTDDPLMAQTGVGFAVCVRKSAGGHIVLGPPSMDTSRNSMYFAFFGEAKP